MRKEGSRSDCQVESVVYGIDCMGCLDHQTVTKYIGESSRNMYLRGKEHQAALQSMDEESTLWQHCLEHHGGLIQSFRMFLIRKHRTPLARQIHEAVKIAHCKANLILNRKGEWNGSQLPRLAIEVGDKVEQVDYNGKLAMDPKRKGGMAPPTACQPAAKKAKLKVIQTTEMELLATTGVPTTTTSCTRRPGMNATSSKSKKMDVGSHQKAAKRFLGKPKPKATKKVVLPKDAKSKKTEREPGKQPKISLYLSN